MTSAGAEIIVVEDERKIANVLAKYLEREGHNVAIVEEGTKAVEIIRSKDPAFVILDLMLPGKDGLSICREVRSFSDVPIMMLTAKVEEIDRLLGLELGADDYVCKPFSPREVVARVKTILRRVAQRPADGGDGELFYRGIALNLDRYRCDVDGQRIDLTPVEFRLLQALAARPGHVFSRDRLMGLAYADDRVVSDRTVDTHIKNIRKKLANALPGDDLIHSIYGVGYKIE